MAEHIVQIINDIFAYVFFKKFSLFIYKFLNYV